MVDGPIGERESSGVATLGLGRMSSMLPSFQGSPAAHGMTLPHARPTTTPQRPTMRALEGSLRPTHPRNSGGGARVVTGAGQSFLHPPHPTVA
jgi:hypothetical protein